MNYQENYDEQIEKETGFRISRHRIIFEGICPECSKDEEDII